MSEQQPALRPCAHCGGIAELEQGESVPEMWCVFCTGCGTTSPAAYKPDAIAAWNRRTPTFVPDPEDIGQLSLVRDYLETISDGACNLMLVARNLLTALRDMK